MDKNKMAMLLFIASETIFFVMLIISFAFFRSRGLDGGFGPIEDLRPVKTGVYSLFLFSSSFSVWRAGRSFPKSRRRGGWWLLATIFAGDGLPGWPGTRVPGPAAA